MSFGKWLENFWYYNKVKIIVGGFLLSFVVIGIYDYATKVNADMNITVITIEAISNDQFSQIKKELEENVIDDINGDGKKIVEFDTIVANIDMADEYGYSNFTKANLTFSNEGSHKKDTVYIVDTYFAQVYTQKDDLRFEPLTTFGIEDKDNLKYYVGTENSKLFETTKVVNPKAYFIGLKTWLDKYKDDPKMQKYYDNGKRVLEYIISH